jgi:hypothetical protein
MSLGFPARDTFGNVLDAFGAADRGAAVFLDYQSHDGWVSVRTRKKGRILLDFQGKNEDYPAPKPAKADSNTPRRV